MEHHPPSRILACSLRSLECASNPDSPALPFTGQRSRIRHTPGLRAAGGGVYQGSCRQLHQRGINIKTSRKPIIVSGEERHRSCAGEKQRPDRWTDNMGSREDRETAPLRERKENLTERTPSTLGTLRGRGNVGKENNTTNINAQEQRQCSYPFKSRKDNANTSENVPKSRPKTKCRFGPHPKRGRARSRSHSERAAPPSPPRHRTATIVPDDGIPFFPSVPQPDRVTLEPPGNSRSTPLDRYKHQAMPKPSPNPYRFVQQRLGITEETFEANIQQKIDELLREIKNTRREDSLPQDPQESPPSSPPERILSKEDCLRMFRETGIPTTSALLGVCRWAADLRVVRFNFETAFD